MIKYKLSCAGGCAFEGWFRSSDDFDAQARDGRLQCPYCASTEVERAIMAPAVMKGPKSAAAPRLPEMREAMAEAVRRARDYVEKNFDYVGERFPEEARRIHYGETKHRDIFGEATGAEAKELVDEGVAIAPLPQVPGTVVDKKKAN
ncbi:MAG: DUF1178 family protein [Parvularculaceae bacterium]|nr:DUF1178 family protein [Parvularculaceae bacterium]